MAAVLIGPQQQQQIQQHKRSDIYLFISHIRYMFRLTISAIIRMYYKNIKGETDRTEEESSASQYYSHLK
jgi:hypothetical protein